MAQTIDVIVLPPSRWLLLVSKKGKLILPWWKKELEDKTDLDTLNRELFQELNWAQIKGDIKEYKSFTWPTPFTKQLMEVKTYFGELDSLDVTPSAEISEAIYVKDFSWLDLSDITLQIVIALKNDGYL